MDGNNLAYSHTENDLGLALESLTVTMPALTGSAGLSVSDQPSVQDDLCPSIYIKRGARIFSQAGLKNSL